MAIVLTKPANINYVLEASAAVHNTVIRSAGRNVGILVTLTEELDRPKRQIYACVNHHFFIAKPVQNYYSHSPKVAAVTLE